MSTYTAAQLTEIPACAVSTVTLVTGESFTGLFDGAFVRDATREITGAQFLTEPPFGVRYVERAEIAKVEVHDLSSGSD